MLIKVMPRIFVTTMEKAVAKITFGSCMYGLRKMFGCSINKEA